MPTDEQIRTAEQEAAAQAEMERYCAEHPRGAVARRRPRLFARGRSWVALHSKPFQDEVAAIGDSVRAALRAFDLESLDASRRRPKA
jgi:hypothetical protein